MINKSLQIGNKTSEKDAVNFDGLFAAGNGRL
jgi:hypothetical protein